jgi:hypothetical protein
MGVLGMPVVIFAASSVAALTFSGDSVATFGPPHPDARTRAKPHTGNSRNSFMEPNLLASSSMRTGGEFLRRLRVIITIGY